MQLLPEGTLRRKVFEFFDRGLCWICTFGKSHKTCSTYLGDALKTGTATETQKECAALIDMVFGENHCLNNAGKE